MFDKTYSPFILILKSSSFSITFDISYVSLNTDFFPVKKPAQTSTSFSERDTNEHLLEEI